MKWQYGYIIALVLLLTSCLSEELEKEILIETGNTSNVEITSAVLHGEIIDYGEGIDQYGHCWSVNSEPSLEDDFSVINEENDREYYSNVSGLLGETTYYYRSYSIDGNNIKYGIIDQFKTEPYVLPMVHLEIEEILYKMIIGNIDLLSMGGYYKVSEIGICLSTTSDPMIDNRIFYIKNVNRTGIFNFKIENLVFGQKYFIKSYAINEQGIKYSFQQSFIMEC
ncbi:MAG: hypothetical protein JEY96_17860 [Bacteroidales bacterium]|nr:hypothetical protein [Bacteroidales bacterium]